MTADNTSNNLIIIDGYSFVFRAYYAMPNLVRRSDNMPTGALYGFTKMLLNLRNKFTATHMVVALDYGSKTFRHDLYQDYKANRKATPPELIQQLSHIRTILDAMHVTYIEQQGYEADDIIATLVKHTNHNMKITIVSSDKDLMQLIDNRVNMYDDIKSKFIETKDVKEKFGVTPDLLLDAFSLIGDSSDNVPGVPSIGPKTAAELINNFGSLETMYDNIDHIKQKKRQETLQTNKDLAFLSRDLITLHADVPIETNIDDLKVRQIEYDKMFSILSVYEFTSLATRIPKPQEDIIQETSQTLSEIIELIDKSPSIILAPQYDQNSPTTLTHLSIYLENYAYVVNDIAESITLLPKLLASQHIIIYDMKKFMSAINYPEIPTDQYCSCDDVMLIEYLLGGDTKSDILSVITKYGFQPINTNDFIEYMRKLLIASRVFDQYINIEKPLLYITHNIGVRGMMIDTTYLSSLSKQFALILDTMEQDIYRITNTTFNLSSPKQMSEILFDRLGYSTLNLKKNKSGDFPTDIHTLTQLLKSDHLDIIAKIIEWRKYSKLQHTYVLPLLEKEINHRVHTNLDPIGTVTGRMSSHNPNLQNIPATHNEEHNIRKAFIVPQGYKLISADYSQIELRILSSIASVKKMQEAFANDLDIHTSTAQEIFGSGEKKFRDIAKTVNFGIVYGIGAFGLAKQLNISQGEAKAYIDAFFQLYPEIVEYVQQQSQAIRKGYVRTIFGRKCYLPALGKANQKAAERFAINAPIQGSNADIIKLAMIALEKQTKIIMQIHDELLFEVKEESVHKIAPTVKTIMEQVVHISVPLKVNISVGNNQADLQPIKL